MPLSTVHIPAPIGGLNSVDPGYEMPELDCPLLFNVIAAENGVRSRLGSQEWVTGLTGAADNTVRSVLPFAGSSASADKLFATTSSGIWDVSASTAAPTLLIAFADTSNDAGRGISWVSVTTAGHFLIYCDEQNGYYIWPEGGPWAKVAAGVGATQINGLDPATFVAGVAWNNRNWFVKKNSAIAGYTLPAFAAGGAVFGTVTPFNFGGQFPHGGDLVGLYSWTVDGGSGPNDRLIAISRGGDVVIYEGTDPSAAATFKIVGRWYVGGVPAGRRIATDNGGDLLILSTTGVLPLSKLVSGEDTVGRQQYSTYKISNAFARLASTYKGINGWALKIHPEDASLMLSIPVAEGQNTGQFAMSLATRGWSQYRDLPLLSMDAWNGKLYFGTADGRVCINTGYLDGVILSDASAFSPIDCSGITRFNNLGNASQKQLVTVRPTLLSEGGAVAGNFEARYRFDLTEAAKPTVTTANPGNSAWGTALWGTGTWGGAFATQQAPVGVTGMGPDAAIAFRFLATSRTVLVGFDVAYRQGGML